MPETTHTPIYKRPWLWLVLVALGVGSVYLVIREPAPRVPLRQALVEVVHDELGAAVNWDDETGRLKGFNLGRRGEEGYLLWLYLYGHTYADQADIRQGMLEDARVLLQRLSTNAAFDSIRTYRITTFLMMPDENGVPRETAVAQFILTREAARQIRWKRLTPDDFERLLRAEGELRLHPTLR